MGTDTRGKQEVEAALLARARVFTDEVAQSISIGEAQHAVAEGSLREDEITELGAVINGRHGEVLQPDAGAVEQGDLLGGGAAASAAPLEAW